MKYTGFHRALEIDRRAHLSSWQIHVLSEVEMDRVDELRQKIRDQGGAPPTYTAFVIKAIAQALSELKPKHPQLNSFLRNVFGLKSVHAFEGISAGCSTALDNEDSVVVGVVLEPQTKPLAGITSELSRFSSQDSPFVKDTLMFYRVPKFLQILFHWISKNSPQIRYERRGTFCLNPVGKFGVDMHISLPQTSSLQFGMGSIRERVVARQGNPCVVKTLFLTLSFDRRLMNGRPPAILMSRIKEILDQADFDHEFESGAKS